MMVAQPVKQRVETLIPTSSPVPYTETLFVLETINWFSVTLTSTTNCQLKPTTVNPAQQPWKRPLPKYHGLALNKSTPFWVKTCTPLVAKEWISRTSRTLLLRCRSQQSLWPWCCWGALQSLHLCWCQHFWYQCWSHAVPMGVPSWTLWRYQNGWWSLDGQIFVASRCWRIWHCCHNWSQTYDCRF